MPEGRRFWLGGYIACKSALGRLVVDRLAGAAIAEAATVVAAIVALVVDTAEEAYIAGSRAGDTEPSSMVP